MNKPLGYLLRAADKAVIPVWDADMLDACTRLLHECPESGALVRADEAAV